MCYSSRGDRWLATCVARRIPSAAARRLRSIVGKGDVAMTYKTLVVGIALAVAAAAGAAAQSGDQAFVTKMGGVAMGEVELGTLAKEKASSRDVKAFAQRMIDDHSKAGEELKAIAQRKNLTWPSGPGSDLVALKDKLSKQ